MTQILFHLHQRLNLMSRSDLFWQKFAVSAQNDSNMLSPRQWISIGDNHFALLIWELHQVMKGPLSGCNGKKVTKGDQNKISSVDQHVGAMSNMRLLPLLLLTGLVSSSEPALRATQVGVPECSREGPRFSAGLPTKTITAPPFLYSSYVERTWKITENQHESTLRYSENQPSLAFPRWKYEVIRYQ